MISEYQYQFNGYLYQTNVESELSEVQSLAFKMATIAKEMLFQLALSISRSVNHHSAVVFEAGHKEAHKYTEASRGSSDHKYFT